MSSQETTKVDELKAAIAYLYQDPPSQKAKIYIGKFFNRKVIGNNIVANVVGNYGTYTVSIVVKDKSVNKNCSCYIGKGGCHHCSALAYTFLRDTESFKEETKKLRTEIKTIEDLEAYLKNVTLEELIDEMKAKGILQKDFAAAINMNGNHLSAVKSAEKRNRFYYELGATKLACLYMIEKKFKKVSTKKSQKPKGKKLK
jgi:hypothetical protein